MSKLTSPFRGGTAISAISAYLLVKYQPSWLSFSKPTYIGTCLQLWFLHLIVWIVWKVIIRPKFLSPLRHIPGPKGGSIINGQSPTLRRMARGTPMLEWMSTIPNDGLIRYLGLFNSENLIPTSPKALSEILQTRAYDFKRPEEIAAVLGQTIGIGLVLSEGEEHKTQRKHLMPAFSFRHIKDLYPVFWSKSRESVEKVMEQIPANGVKGPLSGDVKKNANGDEETSVIDMQSWASRATLDIIGVAGMGKGFGSIQDPDALLSRTYQKISGHTKSRIILLILAMFLPSWLVNAIPVKGNREVKEAADTIRETIRGLVREKRDKFEKSKLKDVDILSVALRSGSFTEDDLVNQMMTFLAAGYETTALSMTWAIYMLCLNPAMQARLRAEIRQHIPSLNADTEVVSQQLDNMPYLRAVYSEVLRYYPSVPLVTRIAARDTVICGQKVPKNTRISVAPWAINRSEELWGPDAHIFNPDRWMPSEKNPHSGNGGASSNYALLSFLHGPRNCIGQGFAKSELAGLLAAWVGKFEFELNDESQLDEKNMETVGITIRPANGLYVKVKAVPGW